MNTKTEFTGAGPDITQSVGMNRTEDRAIFPRRSVVQVSFPNRGTSLSYYNDRFDLRVGDLVYVDGRLEGQRGRVVEVNHNFRIRLSDYQRVIALVDTDVKGQFHTAGSHFVTFDPAAVPASKVVTWFKAPVRDDDIFVSGRDDSSFALEDLKEMKVTAAVARRGHDYYAENAVRYLSISGTHGFAIVEGSEAYEVEFEYRSGRISDLTCSCFCSCTCKHEFAAMLQLKETLALIEEHYGDLYERTGYFAAVLKGVLFSAAVDGKDGKSFTLE